MVCMQHEDGIIGSRKQYSKCYNHSSQLEFSFPQSDDSMLKCGFCFCFFCFTFPYEISTKLLSFMKHCFVKTCETLLNINLCFLSSLFVTNFTQYFF